jgi:hypothetical protein
MPYCADLRCSYCEASLNMSWFYEALSEQNYTIEFDDELDIKHFELYIENCFNDFVSYKVFNFTKNNHIQNYDNVWEYLIEEAIDYHKDGVTINK